MALSPLAGALAGRSIQPAAGGPRGEAVPTAAAPVAQFPAAHPFGAPAPAAPVPAPAPQAAAAHPFQQQPQGQQQSPWPTPQPFNFNQHPFNQQPQQHPATQPPVAHPVAPPLDPANAGVVNVGGTYVPRITQTTTLSPQQQKILDQSQNLTLQTGALGSTLEKNIPTARENFNSAPALGTPGQANQDAINAVYQQQTQMLDPQWAKSEQELKDQLSGQGIPQGSAAYNQAMQQFNNQKTVAYQQAKDSAIQTGYQVGAQTYGEQLAGRQQGVGEASTLYNQPSNTLAQLLSAYNGNPTMPQGQPAQSPISPSDITGAFGLNQQGQQQNYNSQMQQYSSNLGGLTGLAGMLALGAGV